MDHDMAIGRHIASVRQVGAQEADEALARRVSSGDVEAWDEFFDHYSSWVYRFAYHHLGGNHADAEDLCSDILMTAAGSIKGFDATRGSLDVWLLGLARHRLARFCRRRRVEVPLVPEVLEAVCADDSASLDTLTDEMLTRDAVNRALFSLPERQASVLVGKYVEGYSVEELARLNQTTLKAVESLLSRARVTFRTALNRLLDCSPGGDQDGR